MCGVPPSSSGFARFVRAKKGAMVFSYMVSFILHAPIHFFGMWCWFLHVCTYTYTHACTHSCMSLRGGSGAQFPTLIPSSCLPRSRKHTHSCVWFRRVFSPVLPRNQISRNSSLFLVYTKVYSFMCVYDVTHAYLSPHKNEIYRLTHTNTHTHRYAWY